MKKAEAISHLGGSVTEAAKAIGINPQAVSQWPAELSPAVADRVFAAYVRMHPTDWRTEWPELSQQEQAHA